MFKKILIANRGEIAVRIIRACREMDIMSVAICSEADKEALHAQLADETVCIGPAPAKDSYLDMERVVGAAMAVGAEQSFRDWIFIRKQQICKNVRKSVILHLLVHPQKLLIKWEINLQHERR